MKKAKIALLFVAAMAFTSAVNATEYVRFCVQGSSHLCIYAPAGGQPGFDCVPAGPNDPKDCSGTQWIPIS